MKKILLGTTALVAMTAVSAGAAKAEVSVTAWNYMSFGASISADDNSSTVDGLSVYNNSEIRFYGGTELDNGMTVSAKTEMRNIGNGAATIDETHFTLSDSWGSVKLGADDTVMDGMNAGFAWIAGGAGLDSNTYSRYASNYAGGHGFMLSSSTLLSDPFGVTYMSPDMNGLQFGVSYAPGNTDGNTAPTESGMQNNIGAAVAYSTDMDGVSLGLSAGIDHVANTNNEGAGGDDDASIYVIGANVGSGGLAAHLVYSAADYKTTTTAQVDAWTTTMVVSYTMGQHTFGVQGQYAEQTSTVGASATEAQNFEVDYSMDIGGGVYWDVSVASLDVDVPGGTTSDTDATILQSGIGMSF